MQKKGDGIWKNGKAYIKIFVNGIKVRTFSGNTSEVIIMKNTYTSMSFDEFNQLHEHTYFSLL